MRNESTLLSLSARAEVAPPIDGVLTITMGGVCSVVTLKRMRPAMHARYASAARCLVVDYRGCVLLLDLEELKSIIKDGKMRMPSALLAAEAQVPLLAASSVYAREVGLVRRVFTVEREALAWARQQARLLCPPMS